MEAVAVAAAADGGGFGGDLERRVIAAVKAGEERGDPPLLWAMEVARCVQEKGSEMPNLELAQVMVSSLCFSNNTPAMWKLLDQAMNARLLSPIHTLALLTPRVIPNRRAQPEAYSLYLELLNRYALSMSTVETGTCREKIAKSIDDALQLSHVYNADPINFGHAIVLFILCIITSLIDCIMEDCGLQLISADKQSISYANQGVLAMDVDAGGDSSDKGYKHREHLHLNNVLIAIKVVENISMNQKTKIFLRLIYHNMPEKFNALLQRLQVIEAHRSTTQILTSADCHLGNMFTNIRTSIDGGYQSNKHQLLGALANSAPCKLNSCNSYGAGKDACWIPFDIFMEDAMDGKHLYAISAAEMLTELIKTLQIINHATWQETFQALWVSALRLVQRDREPLEGPVPRLDARLCILLSVVPLAIVPILKEEYELSSAMSTGFPRSTTQGNEGNQIASRRHGLLSCIQLLSQYSRLLLPPPSVVHAANTAAAKAAAFISNFKNGNSNLNVAGLKDSSIRAVGSMMHLIVEACIARNLVDTSAYFWPGYVVPSALGKDQTLIQDSPWSTFLGGAPLSDALKNSLMMTPASSVMEVEKLHNIALNGSAEEKSAAAKILCGASFLRGWNIQEHVVRVVVKLLSHRPSDSSTSGTGSYLIDHVPVISAILFGLSGVDTVHILSLYGMVPEVAAILMPLCEAFGSLSPLSIQRSNTLDETSLYSVFSCVFLFLLRLWKFYKPPQEHRIAGRGGSIKMELTLDYLLLLRNSRITSQNTSMDGNNNTADSLHESPSQPIYVDSFPKLRAWYFQNQACISSTLSGLSNKNPVHQIANKILNLICRKMVKVGPISANPSSSSNISISVSSVSTSEDAIQRPMLPAWEVLEAVPFVLEALLTACAHGRLSSRDLTTGLRGLVDFLPASIATIVSYFSAEITRGIWKPVHMNGSDWPNPTPTLHSVESEVKEILASAGVHIQSCYPRDVPPNPMLPLPMAALVSLTITFKLDKSVEYIHGIFGHALENCAIGSSWPSMPIIGALWTQKVRRWHDFIVLSCSRSPFTRDKDAVSQLIRSCFSSFFGASVAGGSHIKSNRGVSELLGQSLSEQGIRLPTKPGFLYLRSCRTFHDIDFVNGQIFKLVIEWTHKFANGWTSAGPSRLKSGRISLAAAATGVQQVATLGASLLYIAGGVELVQVLFEETVPTLLLSTVEEKQGSTHTVSNILEGYAMAYMLILSGAFVWGVGNTSPACTPVFSSRRARVIGNHMDFMAGVVGGNILLGCDPTTWKVYVSCFIGLLVTFAPSWIPGVKVETLRKLASYLRGWHEPDLALALLERGGNAAMEAVVESVL